jgi:hypothetical protein
MRDASGYKVALRRALRIIQPRWRSNNSYQMKIPSGSKQEAPLIDLFLLHHNYNILLSFWQLMIRRTKRDGGLGMLPIPGCL